ncbi:MAG: hypothetical protein AAF974_02840 [Cyanobacteria bacterium P01_E01_bin.34]
MMPQLTLSQPIIEDVFAGNSFTEEISFEEAFGTIPSSPVLPNSEPPIVPEVVVDPATSQHFQEDHIYHTS